MELATLQRDSTTVEITLLEESGSPLVSRDVGKPQLQFHESGGLEPRHMDQHAGLMNYNIRGRLIGSSAYQDAIDLVELLKSHSGGSETILNITVPEYDTDVAVAPSVGGGQALSLAYNPGRRNWVDIDLGLTRVDSVEGGADPPSEAIETTPTATGSGPIEIAYNGKTVPLTADIVVERSIGRPNSDTQSQVPFSYPIYQDKIKTAQDGFELGLEFVSGTVQKVTDLVNMFTQQLARNSMELRFNGLYGLGTFAVVPDGSQALRHVRRAGEQGVAGIPTITLRRVL